MCTFHKRHGQTAEHPYGQTQRGVFGDFTNDRALSDITGGQYEMPGAEFRGRASPDL